MTKDEARAELLSYLQPGDTVYMVERQQSRTGLTRIVDAFILHTTEWTTRLLAKIGNSHNHEGCDCEFCQFRSEYFQAEPHAPGPISISKLAAWILDLSRTKDGNLITHESPEITLAHLSVALFNDAAALKYKRL